MTLPKTPSVWHLYLIRTSGNALYTGITTDVQRRLAQHEKGTGAKALRGKGPLQLVFCCEAGTHGEALRMEFRLKQMNKRQKERLIADQPASLAGWLEKD